MLGQHAKCPKICNYSVFVSTSYPNLAFFHYIPG